ncbi:hypothetical protein AB0G15_12010 [Streptosporangium sp. NPDC023825]|uniref:hypothetical protein n=1 Tax=Streptosporangium sp. NPDC023825 TaxID=3154909 RepID=UPI0034419B9D
MTPETVEVRRGWWVVGITIRTVLLLFLTFGVLVFTLGVTPMQGTRAELRAAAAADRVSFVEYDEYRGYDGPDGQNGVIYYVRWAQGPLLWREFRLPPPAEGSPAYVLAELRKDLGRSQARVIERDRFDRTGWIPAWVDDMPGPVDGPWLTGGWILAFLIMLGSTPRLGNRWAWLWLFTVGQTGALLFLLLEPRPLWFAAGRRPAPRERLSGGWGFLAAIGLGLLSYGLLLAAGYLLNLLRN